MMSILQLLLRGPIIGLDGIAIILAIFSVWVITDCLTKEASEGNDKLAWLLTILMVPLVGALLYFFIRRPERIRTLGH